MQLLKGILDENWQNSTSNFEKLNITHVETWINTIFGVVNLGWIFFFFLQSFSYSIM